MRVSEMGDSRAVWLNGHRIGGEYPHLCDSIVNTIGTVADPGLSVARTQGSGGGRDLRYPLGLPEVCRSCMCHRWSGSSPVVVILGLFVFDFFAHVRTPHAPTFRESAFWSAVYIGIAILFGLVVMWMWGVTYGGEYFAGYVTEKALSVDNLFVFVIIMSTFAVPREYQQKVLLIGIVMALVMRGIFIARRRRRDQRLQLGVLPVRCVPHLHRVQAGPRSRPRERSRGEARQPDRRAREADPADHRGVRRRQAGHPDQRQARRDAAAARADRDRLHRRAVRARLDSRRSTASPRSRTSSSPPTRSR